MHSSIACVIHTEICTALLDEITHERAKLQTCHKTECTNVPNHRATAMSCTHTPEICPEGVHEDGAARVYCLEVVHTDFLTQRIECNLEDRYHEHLENHDAHH